MDNKKTLFMQLQFCMLLAALTVLPSFDFGDFMSRATGVGLFGADSIWVIICKLVGAIGACLAIFKLYKAEPGNQKPMIVYILGGLGSILVVLSIFGSRDNRAYSIDYRYDYGLQESRNFMEFSGNFCSAPDYLCLGDVLLRLYRKDIMYTDSLLCRYHNIPGSFRQTEIRTR